MRDERPLDEPGPAPDDDPPPGAVGADLVGLDPEVEPDPDAQHHARATPSHAALVFLGGCAGVLARDALLHVAPASRDAVPWMLLALNVAGAALLGLFVARVLDPRPYAVVPRLLFATGVLGGFTTYSSLVSAAIVQGHDGHLAGGFVTLLGTSVAGVGAAAVASRARGRRATAP